MLLFQNAFNKMKELVSRQQVDKKMDSSNHGEMIVGDIEFNRVGDGSFPEGDDLYKRIVERSAFGSTMNCMSNIYDILSLKPKQTIIFCDLANSEPLSKDNCTAAIIEDGKIKETHIVDNKNSQKNYLNDTLKSVADSMGVPLEIMILPYNQKYTKYQRKIIRIYKIKRFFKSIKYSFLTLFIIIKNSLTKN